MLTREGDHRTNRLAWKRPESDEKTVEVNPRQLLKEILLGWCQGKEGKTAVFSMPLGASL